MKYTAITGKIKLTLDVPKKDWRLIPREARKFVVARMLTGLVEVCDKHAAKETV